MELLKEFQYFIVEHVTGLSEFEKTVYVERSFTYDKTGETGIIIEVTDAAVKIEFEKVFWEYERDVFEIDSEFENTLKSVHETLCSTDYGINERVLYGTNILSQV